VRLIYAGPMKQALRIALLLLALPLGAASCSGGGGGGEDAGSPDKAALEAAATLLDQPAAVIAAYQPYLRAPDGKDVYAPKRRNDLQKAGACAAGEIRFAANTARQKIKLSSPATKELETTLADISKACTEATDSSAFDACNASVQALDAALGKAGAAAAAAGATAKFRRIAPDAITDEAKKAIAPFLRALGPGPTEQAYFAKRSDEKASFDDVVGACQAAADEAAKVGAAFEHADEPIRLVAVTHKLSLDSQCRVLNETDGLRRDLADCKKKEKSTECKVTCSKVRTRIEEGLPAAVFAHLEEDANRICKE
jgi:hypothetical protein